MNSPSTISRAAGDSSIASGSGSTATGLATTASGSGSFATGITTVASGDESFACGGWCSFLFQCGADDRGDPVAGGGSWASVSDVNSKENFRDLDGEDVLAKLARIPIREWNYKTQDASIRHVGPTAQDFHAAFGLGESSLRINTLDPDGIALRAVQALEIRTKTLREENADLRSEIAALRALVEKLLAER